MLIFIFGVCRPDLYLQNKDVLLSDWNGTFYNKDTELRTSKQEVFLASKMTRGLLEPKKIPSLKLFQMVYLF